MHSFSALDRQHHRDALTSENWDVLIIGGGITGAGILLDAVSRGLKAALVEKSDFASGTSSKSTKLIHGGLRYLKNLEIGLVREVGRERAIVHANARHLVRPEPMLLPMYEDGSIGRLTGSVGLWFYDFLADVEKSEKRKMLSREETLEAEPLLKNEGLLGGGLYYEYRTDDSRLTISILKTAVSIGGLALNYCEVNGFAYTEQRISGVQVIDRKTNHQFVIKADAVVNATGPWLDTVLAHDALSPVQQKNLLLSKGVHIVVPKHRYPIRQSMYFDTPDGQRMIFCIPRDASVYIGTTDTVYDGSLEKISVEEQDIQYLLHAANEILEDSDLNPADVTGQWAGLRPLIFEEGKSPSELSRKDEIFISPNGLISIAGGKLTGYRKMAERIVDRILKKDSGKIPFSQSKTTNIQVRGSEFPSDEIMLAERDALQRKHPGIDRELLATLFAKYGSETRMILDDAEDLSFQENVIAAEVRFAIRNEMATSFEDFVLRRTSDFFFNPEYIKNNLESIARHFMDLVSDRESIFREIAEFRHRLER